MGLLSYAPSGLAAGAPPPLGVGDGRVAWPYLRGDGAQLTGDRHMLTRA